jgi:DNA-binding NtrC family response regulator
LPPLRDRMEDFSRLADHILQEKCRQYDRPSMHLSEVVMARWTAERWPGNLRELANVIERGIILGEGSDLAPESRKSGRSRQDSLPSSANSGESLSQLIARTEAQAITQALRDSGWMLARAAARLRLPSSTLRYKMSKLGIKPPKRIR